MKYIEIIVIFVREYILWQLRSRIVGHCSFLDSFFNSFLIMRDNINKPSTGHQFYFHTASIPHRYEYFLQLYAWLYAFSSRFVPQNRVQQRLRNKRHYFYEIIVPRAKKNRTFCNGIGTRWKFADVKCYLRYGKPKTFVSTFSCT